MNLIVARIGNNNTVCYALEELSRCLKVMDPSVFIDTRTYDAIDHSRNDIIWVGLTDKVNIANEDEIYIDVVNGGGMITGSNNRSVLIAVYRFLYTLGCRWLRPGEDGEIIPKRSLEKADVSAFVSEKASYHHRGICIEGAVSYEHVYNVINWLPKVGMNAYFVQNRIPSFFFKRWYNHEGNPNIPAAPVTDEDVSHIWTRLEEEITKRDILYHAVGHGWTCEPFGISCITGTSWDKRDNLPEISDDIKQYFALVNGKRDLWGGIAINTSLCLTNKEARKIVADSVAEYCKDHPNVDYLHVWLSDGYQNLCECENCRDILPADQYVMLLNDIDKKLTTENIDTKIVFLLYHELLWKPETMHIENPTRYVMMFAPIGLGYNKPHNDYDKSQERKPVAPFILNKVYFPCSADALIRHLEGWQEMFHGDSFDFEYHLMWAHYADPGYMNISNVLHTDMVHLDNVGLNGMMSCQVQRAAFPTGLPMYAMAKALWDKSSLFDDVCNEYFSCAFGVNGHAVKEYLNSISDLLSIHKIKTEEYEIAVSRINSAKDTILCFKSDYLEKYMNENASWRYLYHHAEMCLLYADALRGYVEKDQNMRNAGLEILFTYLRDHELELHNVVDSRLFERSVNMYVPEVETT